MFARNNFTKMSIGHLTYSHQLCSGNILILVYILIVSGPRIKMLSMDDLKWPITFGTENRRQNLKGRLNSTVISQSGCISN